MTSVARFVFGLAMIGTGSAGLIAVNVWLLPAAVGSVTTAAAHPRVTVAPQPAIALAVASVAPSASVVASAAVSAQDVIADAAADAVVEVVAKSTAGTSSCTDGTALPSLRFEDRSRVPNHEFLLAFGPIVGYMRDNFKMKVTLIGHGDSGTEADEYIRVGRSRAGTTLRMLVDYGVSASRITVSEPKVEGNRVVDQGVPPGTVEVHIEPRFETKKGDAGVP